MDLSSAGLSVFALQQHFLVAVELVLGWLLSNAQKDVFQQFLSLGDILQILQ